MLFLFLHLYISFACLPVWVSARLYPINVKTAEPIGPTFCVGHQLTPAVLRIQIRRIRKILASWNRIRENMRIHGSGSNGAKYQPETVKKITLKP